MSAIEYGSYYWCVLLDAESGKPRDFIHLHADDVSIDGGSLVFKSAGRRPVGSAPKSSPSDSAGNREGGKPQDGAENKEMIYIAFAPGSWKMVYAAKLQDGSPASVEHWNKVDSGDAPPDAGSSGYVPPAGAQK
jgi:hypothetical protein